MMDFLKRLYERLAPWYDEEKHIQKDRAAHESEVKVNRLAHEARNVINSYRIYDEQMSRRSRYVHTK